MVCTVRDASGAVIKTVQTICVGYAVILATVASLLVTFWT
jgi:hypothetical protein